MVIESPFGKIIISSSNPTIQKVRDVGMDLKMAKIKSELAKIKDIIEEGIEDCVDVDNPASCYTDVNVVIMKFLSDKKNFPLSNDYDYNNAINALKTRKKTPIGALDMLYPGFMEYNFDKKNETIKPNYNANYNL